MIILAIVVFLVMFSALVLIHEFGHFTAAKKAGVKVEEFGMGLPPRVWGYKPKKSETIYSLNAIPFGGFVRLYGEDSSDKKILKNPQSFAAKSIGWKSVIIISGVLMNFVLAFILLSIGYLIGMQPLFVTRDEMIMAIKSGGVTLEEGLMVKSAKDGVDLQSGDKILLINSQRPELVDYSQFSKGQQIEIEKERGGLVSKVNVLWDKSSKPFEIKDYLLLNNLVFKSIPTWMPGVEAGDEIIKVDEKNVFTRQDFINELAGKSSFDLLIRHKGQELSLNFNVPAIASVVVTDVLANTSAASSGVLPGDGIWQLNGKKINKLDDYFLAKKGKIGAIDLVVLREGSKLSFKLSPDKDGYVGMLLGESEGDILSGAELYQKAAIFTLGEIKNVSYNFWQIPGVVSAEMWKLGVMTLQAFGGVITSIFTKFQVPEGVVGPVGIAQMTYVYLEQGWMTLLRFAALLSISLGVINILPFPGLDGGRLFLILIPAIIGKKVDEKIEAYIHVFGFLILIALIFLITFNDLVRLFGF